MAYVKTTWQDGVSGNTKIDAEKLNNIEDGIETNDTNITSINSQLDDIFFKANDEYTYNTVIAGGHLTGSRKSIAFTIPLPKFAIGLNASILSGTIYARAINGYLLNGTNITAASSTTVQTYSNFLTIFLTYPEFTSATNNTPVSVHLSNLKIKLTSA